MRTLGCCGSHRHGVVYSPKGDELAIGNGDTIVRWSIEMGDCLGTLRGHIGIVTSVAYSPQGNQIASASRNSALKLWDVETGDCLHTLTGHTLTINCVVYSPTGKQVASGSEDWTVRLWDVETGECSRILDRYMGHVEKVVPFAFSPKGNQVASTQYHQVLLWDAETGRSLHTLEDRSNISAIVFSPQGDLLASTGDDSTIRLWDVETGACLRMLTGHSRGITSVVFSPKGDRIVSSSPDMTVRLWDVEFRTSRRTSSGHNVSVHMVKCSPKGDQFASCSDDMTVRLWDVETGTCQHILRDQTRCVEYSPQGHQIATCSRDKTVRLWDVHTGGCTHILVGHSDQVNKVVYSPQGNQLASCSDDQTVRLWDVGSGECLHTLTGHTSPIRDVVYSPNGKQITTCSQDATRLWDITTGRVCLQTLDGHEEMVTCIVYSHRGDLVVSASKNNSVYLWDSASGQCRAVIQDFHHSIKDIAWVEAPNASYVVAGCDDGVVGMWKVVIDGDRCQVRLHWRTSNGELEVAGAVIQDVQGLSSRNMKILKESGAVEMPAPYPSKIPIRLHRDISDPVGPSSLIFVKRFLKLDEEDEGAIKGACGSGG
ncbi:MAG: WD40-repeat-containing domain protein [Benniella sp.]|nr:MAG: WD40-repeat-containing domain protein [Benniella sp.]